MEQRATHNRKRGKLLTPQGLNRLHVAIAQKWQLACSQTFRAPGNEWLAELWDCDTKTVRKIVHRTEKVDLSTLTAVFSASGLTIRSEDYADGLEPRAPEMTVQPLPLQYFQRKDEEALYSQRLLQTRMVTLTGPGGIGKTFLARCLAHDLKSVFGQAIYWLGLDSVSEPEHIVPTIGSALGITHMPNRERSLCDNIGTKRVLIVLDNCEHVLEECARITELLLERCENLAILATSREALGIHGEAVGSVAPLAVPPETLGRKDDLAITERDVAALAQVASVQLLMLCARTVVPQFRITPDNARAVERICRLTDGIPLAIEIIAARLISATEASVATESERMLNLLPNPIRHVSPRHTSLEDVMAWSFALLNAEEQRLLCRLSVFRGDFQLEAVQNVCADSILGGIGTVSVSDLLNRLVLVSLVIFDLTAGRYRLLEPIRQFAQRRLWASGETEACVCRHTDYYLRLSEKIQPHLIGAEQCQALDRLEVDYPNFRLILDNVTLEPAVGMRLCLNLQRLWIVRGYVFEGYHYYARWMAQADNQDLQARFLLAQGMILLRVGQRQTAMANFRRAFRLARIHDQPETIAEALQWLGWLYHCKRRYRVASLLFRTSIAYWKRAENQHGEAICLGLSALTLQRLDRYEEARANYEWSIARLEVFQDDHALGTAFAHYMLHAKELALLAGSVDAKESLLNLAHERGMEALRCCLAVADQCRLGVILYELGIVELRRDQLVQARDYLLQGLPYLQRAGELSKFLECILYLLRIAIDSIKASVETYPAMMSLLVYIDQTKTSNGLHWIEIVTADYMVIHDFLVSRLSDRELRRAKREGYRLERATAAMLAQEIL